jgi:hypothetical protein
MKRLALVTGLVSSVAVPPKDETATFYLNLKQNKKTEGWFAEVSIAGQRVNLLPSPLVDFIGVTGSICKSARICNTLNAYDYS